LQQRKSRWSDDRATYSISQKTSAHIVENFGMPSPVVKVDRRIRWHYTTTILRLRTGARGIEIVNFTTAAPLSAGTLMASAGTPYRLVPAHFYPWPSLDRSYHKVDQKVVRYDTMRDAISAYAQRLT